MKAKLTHRTNLGLRLTKEEMEFFVNEAERQGRPLAGLMRSFIREKMEKSIDTDKHCK